MSTINATESPREIDAWITAAAQYRETTLEAIKDDPQFLEWAADIITPDTQTAEGWIPGWDLDDCARKWFENTSTDGLPKYPARNGWAQDIRLGGHEEFIVTLTLDERTIPDSDVEVKVWRCFSLSYGCDRAESIREAVAEAPRISITGNPEEIHSPRAARALAAALMDYADQLEVIAED